MAQGELLDLDVRQLPATQDIDVQIATAKQYPRDIQTFKRECRELALLNPDTAAGMFYVLKRSGKKIEGPSVRMAEVIAHTWGNLRVDTQVIEESDRYVMAQATAIDLERNVAVRMTTRRRITTSAGDRYGDDMIQVTANAASAIAFREAVFKVVPRSFYADIYESAKLLCVGEAKSNVDAAYKAMEYFNKVGASNEQVLAFLGKTNVTELMTDDIVTLRGVASAIKSGDVTLEEALNLTPDDDNKANDLEAQLSAAEQAGPQQIVTTENDTQQTPTDDTIDVLFWTHTQCDEFLNNKAALELPTWLPDFRGRVRRLRSATGIENLLDQYAAKLAAIQDVTIRDVIVRLAQTKGDD